MISSGGTALAVAAEPVLGRAGYWLMSVTALFSTAGATNAGLYPAAGLCEQMTSLGQFPPVLGHKIGGRAPAPDYYSPQRSPSSSPSASTSARSPRSAAARSLCSLFTLITAARFHVRSETGASAAILGIAVTSTAIVLVTFALTTLVDEPATAAALCAILLLSIGADFGWKNVLNSRVTHLTE